MKISMNIPGPPEDQSGLKGSEDIGKTDSKVEITAHKYLPFHKSIKIKHQGKTYRVKASKIRQAIDPGKEHFSSKDIKKLCALAKRAAKIKGDEFTLEHVSDVLSLKDEKLDLLVNLDSAKRKDRELSSILLEAAKDDNIDTETLKKLSYLGRWERHWYLESCKIDELNDHRSKIIQLLTSTERLQKRGCGEFIKTISKVNDFSASKENIERVLKYIEKDPQIIQKVKVVTENINLLDQPMAKLLLEQDDLYTQADHLKNIFSIIERNDDVTEKEVTFLIDLGKKLGGSRSYDRARLMELYSEKRPISPNLMESISSKIVDSSSLHRFTRYLELALNGLDTEVLDSLNFENFKSR